MFQQHSAWAFELLGFPTPYEALFPIYREGLLEDWEILGVGGIGKVEGGREAIYSDR